MAKFAYRIQDPQHQVLEGVMEAASEGHARRFLLEQKYQVLSLKRTRDSISLDKFLAAFDTVNQVQFNFFVRQLSVMLKAGVPMLPSLATLSDGLRDKVLKRIVMAVYADVEKGSSFSEAIGRHPKAFNALFRATVRSGEAIGELDGVLGRLADILERDYQTTTKIKAALRYPLFALATMLAAFLAATLFIIPRFKDLFSSFGANLPLPTLILMTTSDLLRAYWYVALGALIAGIIGIALHYRTRSGRRFWDRIFFYFPVFGVFIQDAVYSRFARMLGMMLKSGVNVLQALELIAEIVGNAMVEDSILRIKDRVAQGDAIAEQMKAEKIFPLLLTQIVKVGEESGKVDDLLLHIAEFFDAELEIRTKNIESMIEPIFIFILGGFVLIMALGIFLPMWNLFGLMSSSVR
ncbi:MAG: type II secretion system F family protein [Candidatus Omnitrophota bacterium]